MANSLDHFGWTCLGTLLALGLGVVASAEGAPPPRPAADPISAVIPGAIRVATFNIFELSCEKIDQLDAAGQPANAQLKNAAKILKQVRPHILLINEIDYHPLQNCARLFYERYLQKNEPGLRGLDFPYLAYLPVNTGVPSGLDLNNNGKTTDADDAWGYGTYPGQYGMALFSSYRIDAAAVRTFQNLLWQSMPGNLMPDGKSGKNAYYPAEVAAQLRLSSKSHWDVPIDVRGKTLHLLASHPTPPVFDGPEDRNGRRNYDEIRLWADYLSGEKTAAWMVDDAGHRGGLAEGASFVLAGDLNADPVRGDRVAGQAKSSIHLLLDHPRVQDVMPRSAGDRPPREPREGHEGTPEKAYPGDPKTRTSDYGRIDYLLPSKNLEVLGSGIFFPGEADSARALVLGADRASDHNLVFIDLRFPK